MGLKSLMEKSVTAAINAGEKTVKAKAAATVISATGNALNSVINAFGDKAEKSGKNVGLIQVPFSSVQLKGMNVEEVRRKFSLYGFTNIVIDSCKKGLFDKRGSVVKVAINGRDSFSESAKYPPDARVVIFYFG